MKNRKKFCSIIICLITAILFLNYDLWGTQKTIPEVANTSFYVGNGLWDWTIYIKASEEILGDIRCVEYHLHPTFPNPIRTVCETKNPLYPFGHSTNGWGFFQITVKIRYEKGAPVELKHMLKFESQEVEEPLSIVTKNDANLIGEDFWDWTVYIRAQKDVLDQILLVEYTLHPDFLDNVQEVFEPKNSFRAFPLSGVSSGIFRIKIRVFLKNGQVQYLTHDLNFRDNMITEETQTYIFH